MPDHLFRLKRRAELLGNHYRKYFHLLEKDLDGLVFRVERRQWTDYIHLWVKPADYRFELEAVAKLGSTLDEKTADLGCYFALHFLQFNLNALDILLLEVTRQPEKQDVYKQFMLRVGHDFRQLISGYMSQLLKLFLPENYNAEYVFLGVGTRSDQDDIDIGVVDRGIEGREELNIAIARMNAEMLRKAISPHYHISEHVCKEQSFSASIDDFQRLLNTEIHDFVIINEMLGSARILGSRRLFNDFRRLITMRYYYYPNELGPQKFHEGYLRGIIGEVRSLMYKEFEVDRLNPKNDGLRMIKAALYAVKTIYNLRQVNAWALLDALQKVDKKRQLSFKKLEVCLTYLEVIRFLYHMLISQEEEVYVNDPFVHENVNQVAIYMGYESVGATKRMDFFFADYYNKARLAKKTIEALLPDAIDHLERITTVGKLLHHRRATTSGEKRIGNLAIRFLEETKFFRGTRFWDDVIAVLASKDNSILNRLINDLLANPDQYHGLVQRYLEWGSNSYIAFFSFLNLLRQTKNGHKIYTDLLHLFFQQPKGIELAQRFSIVFYRTPEILYEFIVHLSEPHMRQFALSLGGEFWDDQLMPVRDRLVFLIRLHYAASRYLRRIMHKALQENRKIFHLIDDIPKLEAYTKGLLAEIEQINQYDQRMQKIGSYHDVEFLRVCLLLFNNAPASTLAEEFIHFSDIYIQSLYDTCKRKVDETRKAVTLEKADLAILVTGGYGHMLPFDDDYDLIILVYSEDPHLLIYYSSIIGRMNKEISKSGIMPHYLFSDHFGTFLCTISELKSLLDSDRSEYFIDRSQLLGARMIVGNRTLQQLFEEEILRKYVFAEKKEYALSMLQEIKERHEREHPHPYNLKEQRGGLRDIEMILDILRVQFEIFENSNYRIFKKLQTLLPQYEELLQELYNHYEFLRYMRNCNRLIIAADDHLNTEYLHLILEVWQNNDDVKIKPEELLARIHSTLESASKIIEQVVNEVIVPHV